MVIPLIIGLVSLFLFVRRQLTVQKPVLEFRVFAYSMFSLTTVISAVIMMAMFAGMLLLPIYLQSIRGFSPLEAGLLLMPGALIMGVMGPIAGILFDRYGARPLAVTGLIITAITTFQFTRLTVDTSYGHIMLLYTIRSLGMSLLMMPIMTAGLNQLPRYLNSHGTAMANTTRQVAGSIGTAFLVTMMSSRSNLHTGQYANALSSFRPEVVQEMALQSHTLAAQAGLPPEAAQAVLLEMVHGLAMQHAAVEGINDSFYIATGITIVALILAFFVKKVMPA